MTVDDLIAVWVAWNNTPGSERAANTKEDAVAAAGIPGCWLHRRVAAARDAGLSVPDAVQSVWLDHHEKEMSL